MRVLLTNDDGIGAEGLHALRRALAELEGIETHVIVPDSNRSATARSITTRSPLSVEEVELDDGAIAYATDGTPVDCVRFGDLGLVGERPDLIVSGINHGSNLGDDITYSGTVAAALEGIVLGIPAIAISQQSSAARDGLPARAQVRLRRRGAARRRAGAAAGRRSAARGDAAERQLPGRRAAGDRGHPARQAPLQRRAEAGRRGRRRAAPLPRSTASSPRSRTSRAPTCRRSPGGGSRSRPVHFDLTDREGLGRLREWDLDADVPRRAGGRGRGT